MLRRPSLLAVAVVLGIGVPAAILLVYQVQGWDLPTWMAVALPVILIGSVRGTAVLLGWRGLRWLWPRFKAMRGSRRETPSGLAHDDEGL